MQKGLSDVEAARFLGIAPQTLRHMRCRRVGPGYFKIGSWVVYRLEDLEAYLLARRVDPEGQQGAKNEGR